MMGHIDSIESLGLSDGPGIRTVIFLTGCRLRCKYCHNPEMWIKGKNNITSKELVDKIIRFKPYYGSSGGVTFSGGEPLLQGEFLIDVCKKLKQEQINIALDTAGVGDSKYYSEILDLIDLVILDIKHVTNEGYYKLTGREIKDFYEFLNYLNHSGKKVWLRQVVVPNIQNNKNYMDLLIKFCKKIKNVEKIEFLPYHRLGREKYLKLGINYPLEEVNDMDSNECEELYKYFLEKYKG